MLAWPADDPRRGVLQAATDLAAASIDWNRFALRRFAHKSGIHVHGIQCDPRLYEQESPGAGGGRRIIVLSKLIGKTGLRLLLSRFGFKFDEAGIERVLSMIKSEDRLELAESAEVMRYVQACGLPQREECVGSGCVR
jgi:isopropylmalate/homocitrate/citramalate synthase